MHIGCLPYMNTCIRHALISHPGTITWTTRQASQLKPHMYISHKSFSWEHFFSHWVFSSQHIRCQHHILILFPTCTFHSTKTKRALLHQQLPPTSTLHQPSQSYPPCHQQMPSQGRSGLGRGEWSARINWSSQSQSNMVKRDQSECQV